MNNATKIFFNFLHKHTPILRAIKQAGGTPYLVGGCVRDLVLGLMLKDFDIEIHGLTIDQLEHILKQFGPVMLVGKKFGVLRIAHLDTDWSLPRIDSKGRKPTVAIDPSMSIEQACKRRDLTMNAMAIDLNHVIDHEDEIKKTGTFNIIDPYNGLDAIKKNQLRAIDETLFLEDPLRFFRVMQFIGRFGMQPDDRLNTLCRTMDLWDSTTNTALAKERIYEEIKKLLLKSHKPSLGFRWLLSIDRLKEIFPELSALVNTKQRPDYHPEGDVFEHTMQALDAAARLTYYQDQQNITADQEKFLVMLGILCHDLGKAETTNAQLSARGHEEAGVKIAQKLLRRITNDQSITKAVLKLVQYHLAPGHLIKENAGEKAYKRLAFKLAPEVTMRQLAIVSLADKQGRNDKGHEPLDTYHDVYQQFLAQAEHASVAHGPEAPVLLGRHLIDIIPAGPTMGKLLQEAYIIQIEEGIKDVEQLKARVIKT